MLSLTEIKPQKKIIIADEPWLVLSAEHSKMGRAGAVLRTRLKNLKNGVITTKTFHGNDQFEEAEIDIQKAQYLYQEEDTFYFLNTESFEQFELTKQVLGQAADFLKEELVGEVFYFDQQPVNFELPIKITLEVVEAPPAIKGNTADGGSKQVTLETGTKINTPLFIKTGDLISVNTQTGEYAGRAKK